MFSKKKKTIKHLFNEKSKKYIFFQFTLNFIDNTCK